MIKNYTSSFGNNFIGITGEKEKIFLLYKSWGIMSQKIFTENGEYNIDTFSQKALFATRQLAKRQITWIRSWENYVKIRFNKTKP